jgi:hypothetical protein
MPRTFNDSLEEDLERVFFDTSEFATTVTIGRGLQRTPNVAAIVKVREYKSVNDKGGARISVKSIDFDIITSKYVIGGVQEDPQPRDTLTDVAGKVHQVLPLVDKMCFEPTEDGKIVRVHTNRVT